MKTMSAEGRFLARDMPPPALEVGRLDGSHVFDVKGKKYIDFLMGWCVGNLGWGHEVLTNRMRRFKGPEYVYPGFSYRRWAELGGLLASIAPGRLTKCFRATGGSEAVDIALQAAMVHTGRGKFISVEGSYHGNSLGGLSVGSSEYREKCPNLLPGCHKIAPPLDARALASIETRLKKRDVAAFIMEPISINLGVRSPDRRFAAGLQPLLRRYGTLFIADEVAAGFGRTGTLFASEQFSFKPDIMCMAKAMSDGQGAIGAAIATPEIARSMEKRGTFYSTYGWHPRSVTAAIATVRYMIGHKSRILRNVAAMSAYFRERLSRICFRHPATLRIRGLAIGVDLGDADYALKIEDRCRRGGLLVSTLASTLLLVPALTIDRKTAKQGLDILESCA